MQTPLMHAAPKFFEFRQGRDHPIVLDPLQVAPRVNRRRANMKDRSQDRI